MGKHAKKKTGGRTGEAGLSRRETGEDNVDVGYDYLPPEESAPAEPDYDDGYSEPDYAPEPVYDREDAYDREGDYDDAPAPARRPTAARPATAKRPEQKKKPTGASGGKKPVRRKKKNAFRRGLTVYVLLLTIAIVGILTVEWLALDRSQKSFDAEAAEKAQIQAEKEAQEAESRALYRAPQLCFENWLAGCTPEYWAQQWTATPTGALDGYDNVLAEMRRIFDPAAVQAYKSLDYTDAAPVYVLKNGDETLARITLTGSGTDWAVDQVELLVKGEETASVRVSTGSKVFCNGVELGEEFITDSSSYFDYEPLRDQLINPVKWNTYTVEGLLLEPEVTVEPLAGSTVTETADGDFLLCLDDNAGLTYRDKSLTFVKSYLYYFMSGYNGAWGNLYAALAYLTPGTPAYQSLYDTYNGVVWNTAYSNIDTSDTTAGGVVIWADNCYSVDVTYNAKCSLNGQAIDYDSATMRIYFVETDGAFIINSFEIL